MAEDDGPDMARRLGFLTGSAALLLALLRLGRLLQSEPDGPAWGTVLLAATLLGGVLTWTAASSRVPPWGVIGANLLGATLTTLRVAAPSTLAYGLVPTPETLPELERELGIALELIRFGSAPVVPATGLVAVLAVCFWGLGALLAHGAVTRRPIEMVAPALVLYLLLATLDRLPPGWGWTAAVAVVGGAALLSVGWEADASSGRLRHPDAGLLPRRSTTTPRVLLVLMVVSGLWAGSAFAATVPESGLVHWRNRSGIGAGLYGGGSFNLFVGLQQDLVDLSDEPLFYARVSETAPPNHELYWRLITLDSFDGEHWSPTEQRTAKRGADRWEREDLRFQGPTVPMAARVRVASLTTQLLPVIYSPTHLESPVELIDDGFRVREDGSVLVDVRTAEGWEYELRAEVPRPDIAQLASVGGELSPVFQEASRAGAFAAAPRPPRFESRPDDVDHYLSLPEDTSPDIRQLAREVTGQGLTSFEKALILESWFRDSRLFTYSVDVSTGHSSLDLASWLLDPESRNFRTGYCEQFATAFAAMARTLRIPSRVVLGFTPGDLETQADGSRLIVVRERNAHAWVELWMDGQGWVRFDPTPRSDGANPALGSSRLGFDVRAFVPAPAEGSLEAGAFAPALSDQLSPDADIPLDDDFRPAVAAPDPGTPDWVWGMLAAGGLVALVPAGKYVRRRRRLGRLRGGDVTAAWEEIVDRLRDLGEEVRADQTAMEIAVRQHEELVPLASLHSAAAYGGTPRGDGPAAFRQAERVLTRRYERRRRLSAWMSVASLRRRP